MTEACTNVVRHAYPETPGELLVEGWIDDDAQLTVVVIDNGIGLNGTSTNAGLGVGLCLMRELADAHISSDHHGTRVRLTFARR